MSLARLREAALAVLCLAAVAWLWPASLGGATTVLVVSGTSMEPTYRTGDVVIVRSAPHPEVGDVVVVELGGSSDTRVVHRVVERRSDGRLVTKGDNRSTEDGFLTEPDHVIGTARFHIPFVGRMIFAMSRWWMIAALCGCLAALSIWSRTEPPARRRRVVIPDELVRYREADAAAAAALTSDGEPDVGTEDAEGATTAAPIRTAAWEASTG